jgi:dTDP-4-amino-4,6-dideoxygalactose transaminase
MIKISDYKNPFQAIQDFELALAEYTGAPYCVTTDCCSHAIEIAFRLTHNKSLVKFPAKTYLSVLMTMHKIGVPYELLDIKWRDLYRFEGSNIWDCARYLAPNMYVPGTIQCLSFNRDKPLHIGRGGCLLTDNLELYKLASRARSDGRDLFAYSPWQTQHTFNVGYHYTLRPEECVQGLNLLNNRDFIEQVDKYFDYPDCREIVINV